MQFRLLFYILKLQFYKTFLCLIMYFFIFIFSEFIMNLFSDSVGGAVLLVSWNFSARLVLEI